MTGQVLVTDRAGVLRLYSRVAQSWEEARDLGRGVWFWPSPGPGGKLFAASRLHSSAMGMASSIELLSASGDPYRTVRRFEPASVIAPRIPHYVCWSPLGNRLSYVTNIEDSLALFSTSIDEDGATHAQLAAGGPVFHAWHPTASLVAVHLGSELFLVDPANPEARIPVSDRAAGFRTPAWTDDGELLAFAVPADGGVRIKVLAGGREEDVTALPGGVAMAFRPGTKMLTVAVTRHPDTGMFDEIDSVDVETGRARLLTRGPAVSCTWSPDGNRLALVVPAQTGDGRYGVRAFDPDGQIVAATEGFVPSADFRTLLGFFDQYRLSHSTWAADGSWMVVCGRLVSDQVSPSFGDPLGPYVLAWSVERGAELEIIGPGELGFPVPG